ncbi:uncharacterized protein LOC127284895 isoform X2 [Leptopilina boulardi]|uniref:uncharacterized protein LOC127284895 isoform X2 n=1 Tax=Leptopilina boulardi TaxID=63433 RepID=UPI0021F602C7|nr:uncharacterized protein LOC127284895 isoform X2 [Leptopilina boulardi]
MATYRLLFFLVSFIAVVLAGVQSTLSKRQDETIEDSRKVPVNLTATRTSLIATDEGDNAKSTFLQRDPVEISSEEDTSEEDLEENETNDNVENTAEDEYEDELKAVAESHEAMSHDDTKKSNTSFYDSKSFDEKLITAKNFDSKEKSVEDGSDENETSNEADIDEDDIEKKKKDKEVEELLEKKRKRLPTVKKELRTQKEIQADNDTLEDETLTVNVLRMLAKLAENPERWERVHQLLMHLDDGREGSRRAMLARKRNLLPNYDSISTTPKMDDPLRTFKKPKKKKKKKKPHHKTTIASLPVTISSITTTESPWLTTSIPWRLVADNFNSPLWQQQQQQQQLDESPSNLAKVRYSVLSKPRSTGHQLIDEKQRENLKTLNNQRQALMLKSAREYSQPRLLHFGKVNTHQVPAFDDETIRMRNYDPSEFIHFKHSRYPQYNSLPRDFSLDKFQNNFQDDFNEGFARNQEYRPTGREFAASKSWQNSPFDYRKPKMDFRLVQMKNPWYYSQESKPWQPYRKPLFRDYWSRIENDEMDSLEKSWHQRHHPQSWKIDDTWPGDKSLQIGVPPWSEKSNHHHQEENFAWDRARNRSELKINPTKEETNKNILPKITMKSWNSLTSDPATWPFKLPDAKPWPKDQNGKSYNPNADLVRKLGLDKQNKLLSDKNSSKDFKALKYKERTMSSDQKNSDGKNWPVKLIGDDDWMSKVRSSEKLSDDDSRSWTTNNGEKSWHGVGKSISSKSQWEMPVDQSTWRPYDQSYQQDSPNRAWNGRNNELIWNSKSQNWPQKIGEDWNENYAKQTGTTNNWPSKWKQFAYHRVTAMPITKAGSSLEGSAKPKNAFIAVSAVSSSKYNNEWRKNDIEETPINKNFRSVDPDHPVSQLHSSIESPIYAWKKDGSPSNKTRSVEILPSDPLEHQLEDLRLNSSSQNYSKK